MRTVSLIAHYIIVFAIPRDGTEIQTLPHQTIPGNSAPLPGAFMHATAVTIDKLRGYLLPDLQPT